MNYLFGLRGLTWDSIESKYWIVTCDKFGMLSAHSKVPKFAAAADKWVSDGRYDLGLVPTHHEDSPLNMFEVRPGLEVPPGFPQVIRADYSGATHQLPELIVPKAQPKQAEVTPGTIPARHMTQTFSKRNDNTDPTLPYPNAQPVVTAEVTLPTLEAPSKRESFRKLKDEMPMTSSPELVYKCLLHFIRTVDEFRAEEPNWAKIDHHASELNKLLADKWPINEFEG